MHECVARSEFCIGTRLLAQGLWESYCLRSGRAIAEQIPVQTAVRGEGA